MSVPTISPRLTVLLSDLCVQDRSHRSSLALGLIDDVRRMESQNEFLKRRMVELDMELAATRTELDKTRKALAKHEG